MHKYKRHKFKKISAIIAIVMLLSLPSLTAAESNTKPNVLFIAIDDLRPELGCYGSDLVKSPNIDRLADMGTLFERAYCQQSVCGPSRVSLLCGQRPDTTKVWSLFTKFRDIQPNIVTLPQLFKNNGYHSYRLGKIFHTGHGNREDEISWTSMPSSKDNRVHFLKPPKKKKAKYLSECLDVPDSSYNDGKSTDHAIEVMKNFQKKKTPFFLAVGYKKPHLPFVAPKKYWDLYNRETIPDSPVTQPPEGAFEHAMASFGEMRKYIGVPQEGPVSLEQKKLLRHGYLACVSYVDAQIGRLLEALESTGLKENTIVILWSDHGWKLNDYANWCKHSNMEIDTQVPLILSVPGQKGGQRSKALVELVDIYPTLIELCGIQAPHQLDGNSLMPLVENPTRSWKSAVFSQYPRGSENLMGHSIRSGKWRYVEWLDRDSGEVKARELYDHQNSPLAKQNLSTNQEYAKTMKELSLLLGKGQGWKKIKRQLEESLNP